MEPNWFQRIIFRVGNRRYMKWFRLAYWRISGYKWWWGFYNFRRDTKNFKNKNWTEIKRTKLEEIWNQKN